MATRRNWGAIRKLPSGRFQASYIGPDARRHNAPDTFKTKTQGGAWLVSKRTGIQEGTWSADDAPALEVDATNFKEYALQHIMLQTNSKGELLRESTKALYRRTLYTNLKPFLEVDLETITKAQVDEWYAKMISTGKKTSASKAYKLLSAVLKRAAEGGKIAKNPCGILGAQSATTGKTVDTPSADEVAAIANAISS